MEVQVLDSKFSCMMCGACCSNLLEWKRESLPLLRKLLPEYDLDIPYENINGRCEKLNVSNRCTIYHERPLACNTNRLFRILSEKFSISISELYNLQKISCERNRSHMGNM